ncbi:unnamed protein product [Meloidogyne enterolobii]|uniref:Uncharacterized protein n=4 Tax=Meloidogyne TaxID=189290 RepID=A0A6V7WPT7_MELEN|nr:unnamed protein product [Meloidogyne enterolobii]CAD2182108.1 unnamed protein product [Meloidogyne enterolobii]CAD2189020.1 unnamed protein product [Meloidogyne enterolobii]
MALWKDIGITYTRFSQVAAAALRNCRKGAGVEAKKDTQLKITQWDAGKAQKQG